MTHPLPRRLLAGAALALFLCACSPKYDWREVRGSQPPFVVLLPGKPATHTRVVNLEGMQVSMTMTAAEVDGTAFAVTTAELPDAGKAQAVLEAMKKGMVRNIGGTVVRETDKSADGQSVVELEARGQAGPGGQARVLYARFARSGQRVYQAVVLGGQQSVPPEQAETFLGSFKPG
ncbi:hypothetical protein [Noviherbaspirillum galbum]|uniref:Transmembrane protein n=1 Tax=Noviherbaspirillum galbum TaxID=2709383 RepID=A0A6B3ST67_9BURK|nr:hypothetical protein [Noviherbaspirillum galbum]NEX63841.1 hypothetical protein [Noviherbaspirillum galbum]